MLPEPSTNFQALVPDQALNMLVARCVDGPLPQDGLRMVLSVWSSFRDAHGKMLSQMGWTRESLLGGIDPFKATTYSEMPLLPKMLAQGGYLLEANPVWIKFSSLGEAKWLVHPGRWMSAEHFYRDWMGKWEYRIEIHLAAGKPSHEANLAAAMDVDLMDRIYCLPLGM